MDLLVGIVLGLSCALVVLGATLWAIHRRREQALLSGMTKTIIRIEEAAPNSGGMICLVAQFLITGVTVLLIYPSNPWRPDTLTVVLTWLTTVLMLGLIGASYGVRRKITTFHRNDT